MLSLPKQPHAITLPPPCLIVGTIQPSEARSDVDQRTKILLFEPNISNFDSSDQKIFFHSSIVQFWCFRAQDNLICLFKLNNKGFFSATHPHSPNEVKRLFTVVSDTFDDLVSLNFAIN
jgi:hypothetical protein